MKPTSSTQHNPISQEIQSWNSRRKCLTALAATFALTSLISNSIRANAQQPPVPASTPKTSNEVPGPRSFEAIAVSSTEIHCYWLPAEGATGYLLCRDGQPIARIPANGTDYLDTTLTPASTHRYTLQALQNDTASTPREDQDQTFTPLPTTATPNAQRPTPNAQRPTPNAQRPTPNAQYPTPNTQYPRTPNAQRPTPNAPSFDLIVVQASSGGVAAAVEGARRGLRVALIEPTTRLGGMPVNGLSATDLRRDYHASGFLVRFAERVRQFYAREGVKTDGLRYEPRIAHMAMKSLVFEQPNITLFRHARLSKVFTQPGTTDPGRKRVVAIQIEGVDKAGAPTGATALLRGREFVDATDCGDLAAWAGAKFRLGREPRSVAEPHNGVIYYNRKDDSRLPGSTGAGDSRIQAYAYLFVVKDYGPNADKTIPKPPGYRREDFTHSPGWKDSWAVTSGKLPQNKYELNQHPQGGDIQEINYTYPTDSYAKRAEIERRYRDHVLGYLYYIQTEQGQKQLGAPDDEYRDTNGFPPLLYVREGRRIIGEQLPTEADITNAPTYPHPASTGIGDYPMDSHAVRTKTDWNRPDMGEGEWWLYKETPWHSLPLGVIIPQGLDNVFVTTAVSSTHVSFGTYRLEAVRMQFGQAAAVAADLCLHYGKSAREIPARQVQDALLSHAAALAPDPNLILWFLSDVKPTQRHYREIQYLAARGFWPDNEKFTPDAPTTGKELVRSLRLLAARAAPVDSITMNSTVLRPYYPYMGSPANQDALSRCAQEMSNDQPVTRYQVAAWLIRILNWQAPAGMTAATTHYSDPDNGQRAAMEILFDHFIDAEVWDGLGHRDEQGRMRFQPDAPLSHADLFATLYLAQIGLGPLFNDHPIDGRNGRYVPPAPWVIETYSP